MLLGKVLLACQWVMNFFLLNLLFVLGTLAGLVVVGFFPSLYATVETSKKIIEEGEGRMVRYYIDSYKRNFGRSLKLGYISVVFIGIAFINVAFWQHLYQEEMLHSAIALGLRTVWLVVFVLLVLGSLLVNPIAVSEKLSFKDTGRLFLFSLSQLHLYLLLVVGLVILYFAALYFTGAFLLLGGSLTLAWVMFANYMLVKKVHKVQSR